MNKEIDKDIEYYINKSQEERIDLERTIIQKYNKDTRVEVVKIIREADSKLLKLFEISDAEVKEKILEIRKDMKMILDLFNPILQEKSIREQIIDKE